MVCQNSLKIRLQRLQKLLSPFDCDGFLVENPTDLFYLTGLELSIGWLLISAKGGLLMVDGRYGEMAKNQSLYPVESLEERSFLEGMTSLGITALGFDQEKTSYLRFTKIKESLSSLHSCPQLLPQESACMRLRMIKDEEEIQAIKASSALAKDGFSHLLSLLREGILEQELACELEIFWKKKGGMGPAFSPILAFGANSSMPHYRAGKASLQLHSHALIDIGVILNHYCSDMTRVVFWGTPSPLIHTLYEIVEEAKNRATSLCRPGALVGDIDRAARSFIETKGYGPYFNHSLGHGLGLDVHEPPTLRSQGKYHEMILEEGMILTIEPGIYLPNIGGIRLEDTLLITKAGAECLT